MELGTTVAPSRTWIPRGEEVDDSSDEGGVQIQR